MNIKFVSMSMFMAFALTFTACHKSGVYDPNSAKNVSDLKVPEGFDWTMSKDVSLAITSPVETSVSVFSDERCKELLATLPVSGTQKTFTLNVNSGAKNLYVQYSLTDGSKEVLTAPISASRASEGGFATAKLPEGTGNIIESRGEYVMYYPSAGWGTLLFEDMWPSKGDYDFNDVVASYKIQLYLDGEDEGEDSKFLAMLISVRLNALGGHFPYQLCLQIDNLQVSEISEVIPYYPVAPDDGGTYEYEENNNGGLALFSFDWKNRKGNTGGKYYNTEKGFEVSSDYIDKNVVGFMVELNKSRKLSDFKNSVFNFFIRKTEGNRTEIHMMNYAPTVEFEEEYRNTLESNPLLLSSEKFYCTVDRFVWGLKVPANISHAVEDTDFTKAYPEFAKWVTSGGNENQEWYKNGNKDHCIANPL